MGVPRGTRRLWVIGLVLLAAGLPDGPLVSTDGTTPSVLTWEFVLTVVGTLLVLPMDSSNGAMTALLTGEFVLMVAAGRMASPGAAAPAPSRLIAWSVPVVPTLLPILAPLALGLFLIHPLGMYLMVLALGNAVAVWTVFGIAVVVSRRFHDVAGSVA